jgi:3-deoxy-D-manno-octulosonic-acid transferase
VNYLIFFYYHLLWTLLVFLSIPFSLIHKRFRLVDRLISRLPQEINKTKAIWIHALSVGEVNSAVPLIRMLKEYYPGNKIIFTVKTRSGLETARGQTGDTVDHILPMPLDFWWSIIRICRYINPFLYIIVETDLWPGTIMYLKHKQVPAMLVNGRISPRTFKSHKRYAVITKPIWESLDICLMQTDLDRRRLIDIGIAPEKVKTAGNIKFDQDWKEMEKMEKKVWYQRLHLNPYDRIWVAGSLHEGEFDIILDAYQKVWEQFPDLRLVIAPRRMEWVEDIRLACNRRGLPVILKTDLSKNNQDYQVLILDTMGELGRIYGLAEFSFVGGSLVPIGGHNLLEPASFGQPVLFGPYTHNFELMAERLIESGGGKRVSGGEVLVKILEELLLKPALRGKMGLAAKAFVNRNRGALEIVKKEIENTLEIP